LTKKESKTSRMQQDGILMCHAYFYINVSVFTEHESGFLSDGKFKFYANHSKDAEGLIYCNTHFKLRFIFSGI